MPKDADVQSYFKIGQLNATSGIILKYMKIVIPHSLWERILLNTILCFIPDDNNHDKNFVFKIQTILVDYLKENLPIVDKSCALKAVQNNIRIAKK